jgi:hypothetical protein
MTDLTEPSAIPPPVINGALPAEDAAGQTVAAIAEADKISAGKRTSIESYSSSVAVLNLARRRNSPLRPPDPPMGRSSATEDPHRQHPTRLHQSPRQRNRQEPRPRWHRLHYTRRP